MGRRSRGAEAAPRRGNVRLGPPAGETIGGPPTVAATPQWVAPSVGFTDVQTEPLQHERPDAGTLLLAGLEIHGEVDTAVEP